MILTLEQAKWILEENRPQRPRSEKMKELQSAIDVAILILNEKMLDDAAIEKMLNDLAKEYHAE